MEDVLALLDQWAKEAGDGVSWENVPGFKVFFVKYIEFNMINVFNVCLLFLINGRKRLEMEFLGKMFLVLRYFLLNILNLI